LNIEPLSWVDGNTLNVKKKLHHLRCSKNVTVVSQFPQR